MSKRLLKIITSLVIMISAVTPFCLASPSYAVDPASNICDNYEIPASVREANGCDGNSDALPNAAIIIINSVIGILSLVAVVFIIIGGINYMTSAGETAKIEKAKKTILYAVIGLGVCALSFAIVNFTVRILNNDPMPGTTEVVEEDKKKITSDKAKTEKNSDTKGT